MAYDSRVNTRGVGQIAVVLVTEALLQCTTALTNNLKDLRHIMLQMVAPHLIVCRWVVKTRRVQQSSSLAKRPASQEDNHGPYSSILSQS